MVIMTRFKEGETKKSRQVLAINLSFANLAMSAYLFILVSADMLSYDPFAGDASPTWRNSVLCKSAGLIAVAAGEASLFILALVCVERFASVAKPKSSERMGANAATVTAVFLWLLAFLVALVPVFDLPYFKGFYGRSGVCLPLHITPEKYQGWEYSSAIFLGVNGFLVLLISVLYFAMFAMSKRGRPTYGADQGSVNFSYARRMAMVVVTDVAAWLAIIILNMLALIGE